MILFFCVLPIVATVVVLGWAVMNLNQRLSRLEIRMDEKDMQ